MKVLLTRKGEEIQVDDADYDFLSQYNWYVHRDQNGYPSVRTNLTPDQNEARGKPRKKGVVKLTTLLLPDRPEGVVCDHEDRNPLNNQRKNLRFVTRGQNLLNARKRIGNYTSGYKGVYWDKRHNTWVASITVDTKQIYLGSFKEELEAAMAYDTAAIAHHKEYACLNVT